jgi:hypothetical protein
MAVAMIIRAFKQRITRADENAVRQLFQNHAKPTFFVGAALFKDKGGSTVAWRQAPDEKIAELLVTLEFNMTKEYPAVEELSKNRRPGSSHKAVVHHYRLQCGPGQND